MLFSLERDCPSCGYRLKVPRKFTGLEGICGHCHARVPARHRELNQIEMCSTAAAALSLVAAILLLVVYSLMTSPSQKPDQVEQRVLPEQQSADSTWETISIPGVCTYQIPPTLEIQKGAYKRGNDQFRKTVLEISESPDRVVAQPKGVNDFDPVASKRYCRVIVDTKRGTRGDYAKLDELPAVSEAEMKDLDREIKNQTFHDWELASSKGMKATILSWQPAKIVRINNFDALFVTYTRSANDAPPVLVRDYQIQNNDCIHEITISYRESEKQLWADDLGKVIGTFKFTKR